MKSRKNMLFYWVQILSVSLSLALEVHSVRADWDGPDGSARSDAEIHQEGLEAYEKSIELTSDNQGQDDKAAPFALAALFMLGKKVWICDLNSPDPYEVKADAVVDKVNLEEKAIYNFYRSEQESSYAVSIRDVSPAGMAKKIEKGLDIIVGWFGGKKKPVEPKPEAATDNNFGKTRTQACAIEDNKFVCYGIRTKQYIRYTTRRYDGKVEDLLLENTYGVDETEILGDRALPPSKSNPDRKLGSFYHCITSLL